MPETLTRVAILASGDRESYDEGRGSGGGSTMNRFARDILKQDLGIEVGLVVCNNPRGTVGVYDKIDAINKEFDKRIEVLTINGKTHPEDPQPRGQTLQESLAIYEACLVRGIGDILLLGYQKQLNGKLIEMFGWKPEFATIDPEHQGIYLAHAVNTHPGILPETADTHGEGASQKAIDLGLESTAHTLQVVAAGIDAGPTITQNKVRIEPGETAEHLFGRVQDTEKDNIAQNMADFYRVQRSLAA